MAHSVPLTFGPGAPKLERWLHLDIKLQPCRSPAQIYRDRCASEKCKIMSTITGCARSQRTKQAPAVRRLREAHAVMTDSRRRHSAAKSTGWMPATEYRCLVSPLYSCKPAFGANVAVKTEPGEVETLHMPLHYPRQQVRAQGNTDCQQQQSTCACALRRSTLSRHSADLSTSWKRLASAVMQSGLAHAVKQAR